MVGKSSNLRNFLKKEIAKDQSMVKVPDFPSTPLHRKNHGKTDRSSLTEKLPSQGSSDSPFKTAKLKASDTTNSRYRASGDDSSTGKGDVADDSDVDSLFGEPLDTPSIKDQERKTKLEKLLAQEFPELPLAVPRYTESSDLQELKEELKNLVFLETGGTLTERELALVGRQKGSLIEEIRQLEELERKAFKDESKRKEHFPEPYSYGEKEKIQKNRARLERSRAKAADPPKPKRTRQQVEEDRENENALDGEERLRLGKRIKTKPALNTTGRFRSTRHDYFPGLGGAKKIFTDKGDEVTLEPTLRDFSPEERKLRRRELADLAEKLAKADQRK